MGWEGPLEVNWSDLRLRAVPLQSYIGLPRALACHTGSISKDGDSTASLQAVPGFHCPLSEGCLCLFWDTGIHVVKGWLLAFL